MFRSFQQSLTRAVSTSVLVLGAVEVTTHLPSEGRSSETYHRISDELVTPLIRRFLNPEDAHNLALTLLQYNLAPTHRRNALEFQVDLSYTAKFPRSNNNNNNNNSAPVKLLFPNVIGLAAGFDKDAKAIHGLIDMGFGFVEIGSVTPLPQPGNPKPRMFRLSEDYGVINRFGFNSTGVDNVLENIKIFRLGKGKENETIDTDELDTTTQNTSSWSRNIANGLGYIQQTWNMTWNYFFPSSYISQHQALLGINVGKNKLSLHETEDYVTGISKLGIYADYITINISSPNTPGLRDLQKKEPIRRLFQAVLQARDSLPNHTWLNGTERQGQDIPLFVKISPDLSDEELDDIASAVMEFHIDGVLISNTTNQRPSSLQSLYRNETGGLSGRPLKNLSTECIRKMYQRTGGQVFLIGIGGVESGKDAYDKLRAGASVIQLYSALVYQGPGFISRIRRELAEEMLNHGYRTVDEVIGLDHEEMYWRRWAEKIHNFK